MNYNKRVQLLKQNTTGDGYEYLGGAWASFRSMTTTQILQAKANHIEATIEVRSRYRDIFKDATHIGFKNGKYKIETFENINAKDRQVRLLCSEVVT